MESFTQEDYFVTRVPILSIRHAYAMMQKIAINNDELSFISMIKALFSQNLLQEAIYIASDDLYTQLLNWQAGGVKDRKKEYKLAISLYKYFLRMCTRSTPFGLFAGIATGRYTDHTDIMLNDANAHHVYSRLDMKCVAELVSHICNIPDIRKQLLFYPNNSIYRVNKKYRYVEYVLQHKIRQYNISSVDHSPYLEKILALSKNGCCLESLARETADEKVGEEECLEFTNELVKAQILVSELDLTVTGPDYFTILMERLEKLEHTEILVGQLTEIDRLLKTEKHRITGFKEVFTIIQQIAPSMAKSDLIQTDTFLSCGDVTLKLESIRLLNKEIEKIFCLSQLTANTQLDNFRNAFVLRYEENEMPLLEVLDTELGIGYASGNNKDKDHAPLIDDIITAGKVELRYPYDNLVKLRLKKMAEALQNKSSSVRITDQELEELKKGQKKLVIPDSFFLLGNLLASSNNNIDSGDFRFNISSITGPSSFKLLTRFCYGDKDLENLVKESIIREEAFEDNTVYAEVVHFPNAREANVVKRVNTRKYEIPFLGMPSVPFDQQIPLTDLMVSVQGNRILLRSKRLNKYVLPRLSTAHNYDKDGLPVYRFLGDMQYQGINIGSFWNWGVLDDQPFLPRIEYGHFILCRARWKLFRKDHPALKDPKTNITTYFRQLVKDMNLPRYVCVTKIDHELLLDLESHASFQILKEEFAQSAVVVLSECLIEEANCFIKSPDGLHFNEMIIPYTSTNKETRNYPGIPIQKDTATAQRDFLPDSEWLYVKLYTGTKSAEKILGERLGPFMRQLLKEGLIDKWFFIRFRDPDHHLRIRLHKAAGYDHFLSTLLGRLNNLLSGFIQNQQLWKIQLDTYSRELERYGVHTIDMTEDIFCYDSLAVVNFIAMLEGAEGEKYRWLFSLRGIDMLLDDFGFSLKQKFGLLESLYKNFYEEFGAGLPLSRQLNDKYRQNTKDIQMILDIQTGSAGDLEDALELFETRSYAIRLFVPVIKAKLASANDGLTINALVQSYIHMFMNRLFVSNQRKHELVVYHHLAKYYESLIARRNAASGMVAHDEHKRK